MTALGPPSSVNTRPLPGQTRDCLDSWFQPFILTNGDAWPCCWFFQKDALGNVHKKPFDQIINGPEFQTSRRELLTGDLRKVCVECPSRGLTKPEALLARLRTRLEALPAAVLARPLSQFSLGLERLRAAALRRVAKAARR